jgi:hypothetical protein
MKSYVMFFGLLASLGAAEFPQAEISGGGVRARIYLPDPRSGYYRATRFDWAGVIPTVLYKNHEFFGQWFPSYDPNLHDSIVGPVESFDAIGYDQARPGGTFLRIGVGVLRRDDERPLNNFTTYKIVDGGKWSSRAAKHRVEITHALAGVYLYKKTVRLDSKNPILILEHSLKNTGKETLETDVYNHDFYMIGGLPSGPDVTVTFPFETRSTADLHGLAEFSGKQMKYNRELTGNQSIMTDLEGFGPTAKDYDIRVENRSAKAGVRQTSDHPISKLRLWSIHTTVCPEAYTHVKVEPGKEFRWRVAFEFYEM